MSYSWGFGAGPLSRLNFISRTRLNLTRDQPYAKNKSQLIKSKREKLLEDNCIAVGPCSGSQPQRITSSLNDDQRIVPMNLAGYASAIRYLISRRVNRVDNTAWSYRHVLCQRALYELIDYVKYIEMRISYDVQAVCAPRRCLLTCVMMSSVCVMFK